MQKAYIYRILFSATIMLLPPWLTVTFAKSNAAMAICFLLFFAVNPVYSIYIGAYAGKNIRYLWALPVISAVLFLLGTWIFFDMGESAFILYAGIYLFLGAFSMFISSLARKKNMD